VRLTPGADAHGLALASPEEVEVPALPGRGTATEEVVLARPTGFEHGHATILVRVPIAPRPW